MSEDYFDAVERQLAGLCRGGAHRPRWRRPRRSASPGFTRAAGAAVSVLVVVVVVGLALGLHHRGSSAHPNQNRPGGHHSTSSTGLASKGRARRLVCDQADIAAPSRNMTMVLGVVSLPASPKMTRALQTARTGLGVPAARLFAKWGLFVRAGATVRLIVPERFRHRLSIGWGNNSDGHRGNLISVTGCAGPPGARWLVWPGGYYVRDPVCAPLIIEAGGQRRRVQMGIGKPCPGQRPAPNPTQK